MTVEKKVLNPVDSAEIMEAYSHGISVLIGDKEMIFVTGQIAMDKNGEAVAPMISKNKRNMFLVQLMTY